MTAAQRTPCWQAPIKLNLFLHINGRRPDGYHDLQTYFELLDYGDRLWFALRDDSAIRVQWRAGDQDLAARPERMEDDLVYRAARALQQTTACQRGADILVEKNAPIGGGVGGGSAAAATTLLALNRLWSTGLPQQTLLALGRRLGADVPVFIHGRSTWAEETGDTFADLALPPQWYLIAVPGVGSPTAGLFADPKLARDTPRLRPRAVMPDWQVQGHNAFEPLVLAQSPTIRACYEELRHKAGFARLTGTGACLFAPVPSQARGLQLAQELTEPKRVIVCRTLQRDIAEPLGG